MSLADAADLTARYDRHIVADLGGDEGTPTDPASSPRVAAALEGATGEILAAARMGGRYSAEDLAQLTGADAAYLKDIVCLLAVLRLVSTRIQTIGEAAFESLRRQGDKILADLRNGLLVFGTPAASRAQTPQADGPEALDYELLNLLPDRTKNYYPARGGRIPIRR
ncbi:MAG: hypothetical protein Kow0040_17390 [Thermogutta sp.]